MENVEHNMRMDLAAEMRFGRYFSNSVAKQPVKQPKG